MNRETIATGKTVEEAIEKARRELGCAAGETGFEILELPRRGFLGLRRTPAKVRVYVTAGEEPAETGSERPTGAEDGGGKGKTRPAEARAGKNPARPDEQAASRKPDREKAPPAGGADGAGETDGQSGELSEKAVLSRQYVSGVIAAMGVKEARVSVKETGESIEILLEGAELGVVIGRRGETLDALQYLTSLVANRLDGSYIRVSIDSGGYRKKRAETLERLAVKIARGAVKTGRAVKLEPMNPYERRIIHAAVARVEGAASSSIGEEPNRRVVVTPRGARRVPAAPRERDGAEQGEGRPSDLRPGDLRPSGPRPGDLRPGDLRPSGPRPGGPRPPRRGGPDWPDRAQRPARTGRAPLEKKAAPIRDAEIEIPKDLAPRDLPPAPAAPVRADAAAKTPTQEEKNAVPLYGKLDI